MMRLKQIRRTIQNYGAFVRPHPIPGDLAFDRQCKRRVDVLFRRLVAQANHLTRIRRIDGRLLGARTSLYRR